MGDGAARPPQRRWGLRTLGFLAIAAAALLSYDSLRAGGFALFTTIGLVVGLGGAIVCTVQGLRSSGLPR